MKSLKHGCSIGSDTLRARSRILESRSPFFRSLFLPTGRTVYLQCPDIFKTELPLHTNKIQSLLIFSRKRGIGLRGRDCSARYIQYARANRATGFLTFFFHFKFSIYFYHWLATSARVRYRYRIVPYQTLLRGWREGRSVLLPSFCASGGLGDRSLIYNSDIKCSFKTCLVERETFQCDVRDCCCPCAHCRSDEKI